MGAQPGNKQASKFNEQVKETICDAIREGKTKTVAFRLAGIHPDTGFDWLRYAKQDPIKYAHFVELQEGMDLAEAEFMGEMVDQITATAKSGAPNTWQAAAWMLERKHPEEWGKRDKVQVEGGDTPLIQFNQLVLTDADTRELSRDLLRRVTAGRPSLALGPGMGDEPAEDAA